MPNTNHWRSRHLPEHSDTHEVLPVTRTDADEIYQHMNERFRAWVGVPLAGYKIGPTGHE